MKAKRIISTILAVLTILTSAMVVSAQDADNLTFDFSLVSSGVVSNRKTAKVKKNFEFDGVNTVFIAPTHDTAEATQITLDSATLVLEEMNIDITKYKYIGITYYYETRNPVKARMNLALLANGGLLKKSQYVNALGNLVGNQWTTAYFNMESYLKNNVNETGIFKQFHLAPFGAIDMKNVAIDDVMYIQKMTFYAEKTENMDAEIKEQNRVEVPAGDYVIPFSQVTSGVVNSKGTAKVDKKATVDGKDVTSIVPTHDTAQKNMINIDSATGVLEGLCIDLRNYKYVGIKYKYVSEKPVDSSMFLSFLSNGGMLKSTKYATAKNKMITDTWATSYFDLAPIKKDNINDEGIFKQFHFSPFGYIDMSLVDKNDILYIDTITFYREKPPLMDAEIAMGSPVKIPDGDYEIPFSDISSGVVSNKKTATVTKNVNVDGKKAVMIVPTHETAQSNMVNIDSATTVLEGMNLDLTKYKYIGIKYKYLSDKPVDAPMFLSMLSNGGKLKKSAYQNASEKLVTGKWTIALYDMSVFTADNLNADGVFKQFHLSPFGYTDMKEVDANDVMFIESVIFYVDKPETLDISGSADLGGETENKVDAFAYPDAKATSLYVYHDGIASKRTTATVNSVVFDGIECAEVIPTPDIAPDNVEHIIVDGYRYAPAEINLDVYKYAAVVYRYDSANPLQNTTMYMTLAANNKKELTSSVSRASAEQLVSDGNWHTAVFDFTNILPAAINRDWYNHNLSQMYIYPFGRTSAKKVSKDDRVYLASVIFFKEKPEFDICKSYMTGYEDSTFRPANRMTRAQACTVVARLSAGSDGNVPAFVSSRYSDITGSEWYAKYIAYCEKMGYLDSFTGNTFNADSDITRAEFVSLVFAMGLTKKSENGVTFNDVPSTHTRYSDITAAAADGLVNGYLNADGTYSFKPDNPITRAEVVKVINTALGRNTVIENISSDVLLLYPDVDKSHWAYAEIAQASISHTQLKNGNWTGTLENPEKFAAGLSKADFAATDAYLASLDATANERKAQIRASATSVEVTGTKYYVANDGNDANDGKSPETAWQTIERVNLEELKNGDGVFFKRGNIWRNVQISAKAGVTYSAYGEGDKPKLYGSPENGAVAANWTLYHEDANQKIWVYNKELDDVGLMVFNDGEKYTTKAIPTFKDGRFVVRDNHTVPFDIKSHLTQDLMLFSEVIPSGVWISNIKGKLYLRCDAGNPGEVFDSIEFNIRPTIIEMGSNSGITVDNLCMKYSGTMAVHAYDATEKIIKPIKNMTVQNCEIGWIGGSIQSYIGDDGKAVRLGNGVEMYGGCDGYLVENCYIYQCYDAGVTHQRSEGGTEETIMNNVTYRGNLIEYCIYGIEYFLNEGDTVRERREGENILMENNIIRYTGEGFGKQRPDGKVEGAIKGGSPNRFTNFVIRNNVFDRSTYHLLRICADHSKYLPKMEGNVYIQRENGLIAAFGAGRGLNYVMNYFAEHYVNNILGDKTAKIYYVK